jgi:hypothetical protein
MSSSRLATAAALLVLLAACGGADPGAGAQGTPAVPPGGDPPPVDPPPATPPAPGTPPPAVSDPNPPPTGGSGSNRFEMGTSEGLYLVDPAQGEASVKGFVVVTLGPIGTGSFIPPADTVVTLNGVPLLRDPNLNGAYWRVDPAGPQPVIGTGGRMVLVASATDAGQALQRTLVLPCPSDVVVTSTPAFGSALAPGDVLHLASPSDLTLNTGIASMAGSYPTAMLSGYDPATRALLPAGGPVPIAPGPLALDVTVAATAGAAYLLDLRWPGTWVVDGQTGGFCGLAKRWMFAR